MDPTLDPSTIEPRIYIEAGKKKWFATALCPVCGQRIIAVTPGSIWRAMDLHLDICGEKVIINTRGTLP